MSDDFIDRLAQLNNDNVAGPEASAGDDDDDATDAFLKRIAMMDLSMAAPPGCAPMNPNYVPDENPLTIEEPAAEAPPEPKPKPKAKPKAKPKPKARPKPTPAPSSPPPADDVNIEEALASEAWKERKAAYEQMQRCFDRKANFSEYGTFFEKCLEEKNKMAWKELGKAFLSFAKNAPDDMVRQHMPAVLEGSGETLQDPVKMVMMEVWATSLECVEFDTWFAKVEPVMKIKSKKVPGFMAEIVQKCLSEFGAEVVDAATVLDWAIEQCKSSSDATVKKASQEIIVMCYGALGSEVADAVEDAGVKKAIVKSLTKKFKKAKAPTVTRYRRGDGPSEGGDGGEEEEEVEAKPSPKPKPKKSPKPKKKLEPKGKDIWVDLDKDFEDNMNGSSWKPKKAGLDELCEACDSAKKIAKGDRFAVVVKKLPELCGDGNMNVITVALKAAGILAEKMKPKDFHELGVKIIPHAVQQWKQKKSSIKLYNDQLFLYMITKAGIKFSDMAPSFINALKDRQATIKTNTTEFLSMLAANEEAQPLIVDDIQDESLLEALKPLLKDKDAKIRKGTCNSIGHIAGLSQNGSWLNYIDSLEDDNKNAFKAISPVVKGYEGKAPVGAVEEEAEPEPAPPPPKKKKKATPKKEKKAAEDDGDSPEPKKEKKPKKARPKLKARGGKARGGGRAKPSKHEEDDAAAGDKDPISAKDKSLDKYGEGESMSSEDAGAVIAELLEDADAEIDDIDDKKWGTKEAALQAVLEKVKEGGVDSLAVIRFFMYKGMKQSNANASKKFLEIITAAVRMDPEVTPENALIPLDENGIFPLFGDKKCTELCKEFCEVALEAVGPKIFIPFALAKVPSDSRSSKIRGPLFQVLADAVKDYGMSSTNWKFMIMKCHEFLNAGARGDEKDALTELFAHCYQQTGTFFRNTLFTSVANARTRKGLQEVLDPIEEDGSQGKWEPTKKPRNGDFAEPLNMDTLVPRKDLSKDLSGPAGNLSDKNWKVRKAACEEIEEILKANGNRMQAKLPASLWTGLRQMQKDTNNNLKVFANKTVGLLVVAGGDKMSKHRKEIIPNMMETAAEQAKPVSRAAAEGIKVWGMEVGYKCVTEFAGEGLKNAKARPTLVPVIAEVITHYDEKGVEMELGSEFLHAILACCIDKDAKIKSAVKAFFPLIMKHAGGKTVLKAIGEFKSSDQATLQKGLKKFLASIEADAPKKKKKDKKEDKKKKKDSKKKKKKEKEEEEEPEPEPEPEEESIMKPSSKARKARLGKRRKYKGSWNDHGAAEIKAMKKWGDTICNAEMNKLMFGERAEFKQWQQAMKLIEESLDSTPDAVLKNMDMIYRWSSWRCCEKNATNSDMAFMNFWKRITDYYKRNDLTYEHHESDQIIPMMIERCMGSTKKQISDLAKDLFELFEDQYSPLWMARYLWDNFDVSKNGRSRIAAIQELNRLFNDYGIEIIAKKPGKKQLLVSVYKHMQSGDNSLRKACIPIYCTFAHILGKEKVLKVISKAQPAVKDLIAARLQKVSFVGDFAPAKSSKYEKSGGKEPAPAPKAAKADSGGAKENTGGASPQPSSAPMAAPEPQFQPMKKFEFTQTQLDGLPAAFAPINWNAFAPSNTSVANPFDFSTNSDPAGPGLSTSVKSSSTAFPSSMGLTGMPDFLQFSSTFAMPGMNLPEPSHMAPPETIPDIIAGLESKRADCLEALCNGFKGSPPKWSEEALKPHTKRLVTALITWWQDILNNGEAIAPAEKQTLSENLIECLYDISLKQSVLATLSMESLETFIRVMLISLISPAVRRSFSNRKSLIARLNDITLGVLQNCDRTAAFYILISFLKQAEPEETDFPVESSANFSNVVVKCLAKLMILIPKVIRTMKVDQILQVIHQFFTLKPPKVWNRPGCNNKPYRVARTCLSKFVEFKGPEILQDLRKVVGVNPNPKPVIQLFTEEFIEKKFPNYDLDNPATRRAGSGSNILRSSSSSLPGVEYTLPRRISETNSNAMSDAQINHELTKIVENLDPAERGYADAGLQRLYDFKQSYPQADLETVLVGKTDVFQGFVRRGLKQIEENNRPSFDAGANRSRSRLNRTPSNASVSSIGSLTGTNTSKMSTEDLRDRLNKLRNSSVARTSRKRDNSISIDNIRDRLAKFQTTTVGRTDSITSTPYTASRQDSAFGGLNRESSFGSGSNFGRESSISNFSAISGTRA